MGLSFTGTEFRSTPETRQCSRHKAAKQVMFCCSPNSSTVLKFNGTLFYTTPVTNLALCSSFSTLHAAVQPSKPIYTVCSYINVRGGLDLYGPGPNRRDFYTLRATDQVNLVTEFLSSVLRVK